MGHRLSKSSRSRAQLRRLNMISEAVRAISMIESLEQRLMLTATTVSGQSLLQGFFMAGSTFNYTLTDQATGDTATETYTAKGKATAPTGGQSSYEYDTAFNFAADTNSTDLDQNYIASTSTGVVQYEDVSTETNTSDDGTVYTYTDDDTYSPPELYVPASVTVGQTYESDYTDTDNSSDSSAGGDEDDDSSYSTEDATITVVGESTITVPAGTFDVYDLHDVSTETDYNDDGTVSGTGSSDGELYLSPGIGLIEETVPPADGSSGITVALTSYNLVGDKLSFPTTPANTDEGKTIAPVTVDVLNADGTIDTNSSAAVTLSLLGGNGTLSGTTTVNAVNGIATFSDLSVNKAGDYQLQANSIDGSGPVTSNQFQIGGDKLVFTTEPGDSELNAQIPMVVTVEDSDGNVDADADGTIDLSLNTVSGGDNAVLGGTISVDIVDGVGKFTTNAGPTIDTAGTYTFTATQDDDSDTPVNTTTTATSDEFTVSNSLIWTGGGDGVSWSDPKNWDKDAAPEDGADLIFPANHSGNTNNDITGLTIDTIDLVGGGYSLTGDPISLTGGLASEAGNNTYDIDTKLVGSPTLDDVAGDLTIASVFSGDGLTISGSGSDTFDQTDTYTGTTILSPGVTIDDSAVTDAFGDGDVTIDGGSGAVTIDDTGSGAATLDNDVTFENGSTLAVDPTVTFTGDVTLNGSSTLKAVGNSDLLVLGDPTSTIDGSGTITLAGEGTVQIVGLLGADVQVAVTSGTVELDGFLDGESGASQVTDNGGTVQLTAQTRGNGGIDMKTGTLISASDGSGYYGTITLETVNPSLTRVQVSPGKTILGNGPIIVDAIVTTAGVNDPTIVAPDDGTLVTLSNAVTLEASASLSVRGQVSFAQALAVDAGAYTGSDLFTVSSSDDIFLPGGVQGTGTLSLGGPGTIEFDGNVASGITLNATAGAGANGPSATKVVLDGTLQAAVDAAPQFVADCALSIDGLSGSGGIDLEGGAISIGSNPSYSGTIIFERSYFANDTDAPTATVTSAVYPFGTGLITTKSPQTAADQGPGLPSIDDSTLPDGLVLQNTLQIGDYGSLNLLGAFEFSNPITMTAGTFGLASIRPSANKTVGVQKLQLDGGVIGSGSLTIYGDVTVDGTIGSSVDLYFGGPNSTINLNCDLEGPFLAIDPQILATDATVILMPGFTGTGDISIEGGTLESKSTLDYSGGITLAEQPVVGGMPEVPTVVLDTTSSPLGTGQITLDNGGIIFDTTGAGGEVTLSNPVSTDGNINFALAGSLAFGDAITMDGTGYRFAVAESSDFTGDPTTQDFDLLGGLQGNGIVELQTQGVSQVTGDIAEGMLIYVSELNPVADSPNTETVNLAANLLGALGAYQLQVSGGTLHVLSTLQGTGGIDVGNFGILQTAGIPGYSGNVKIDPGGKVQDSDSVNDKALGTGTLTFPAAGAGPTLAAPTLDASAVAGDAKLAVSVAPVAGSVLNTVGTITFESDVDLAGQSTFTTTNAGDQLYFTGLVQGSGTLTAAGPGTIDVIGILAAGTGVATDDSFTGTMDLSAALNGGGATQVSVTAGTVELIQNMTGSGGIDVSGGTLLSRGVPGYSGPISLESGGTIQVKDTSDDKALGTGSVSLNGGTLQNISDGTATLDNQVTVNGTPAVQGGTRLKFSGNLNLSSGVLNVTGTVAVTGTLSGSAGLTLQSGVFAVAGSNPGFSGTITVVGGTIQVVSDDALGTGPLIARLTAQGVLQSLSSVDPVLDNPLTIESGTLEIEGQFTFPAGVTIDAGTSLDLQNPGTQVIVSGPLAGSGDVVTNDESFQSTGSTTGFTGDISQTSTQSQPTITVTDAGGIYTGASFPASAQITVNGGAPTSTLDGVSPTFTYYTGSTTTGTGSSTAPSAVGMYTVVATYPGDASYLSAQSGPVTFSITSSTPVTKTQPTLTVMDADGVYTGSIFPATVTISATGVAPSNELDGIAPTLTYYSGPTATGTPLSSAPIATGTYTVVASYPGDANYTSAQSNPLTFSITAATGPTNPTHPTTVPNGPFALVALTVSSTEIDLYWHSNSNNESGFYVERETGNGTFMVVATLPAGTTNYQDTKLSASTTYEYRVRAFNSLGDSSYTGVTTASTLASGATPITPPITPATTVPNAPYTLTVTPYSSTQIHLTWHDNPSDEAGYAVERSTGNGTWSVITLLPVGSTTFDDTGLSASTGYTYRIYAYNALGDSSYAGPATTYTLSLGNTGHVPTSTPTTTTVPNGPFGVTAQKSNTGVTLQWHDNSDNETGFIVERQTGNGLFTPIAELAANTISFLDNTATTGQTYTYRVYAFNDVGDSSIATSNAISV